MSKIGHKYAEYIFAVALIVIVLANMLIPLGSGVRAKMMVYSSSSHPWWNENWAKRRPITINNSNNSSTLENYQVQVIVAHDNDMLANFADLRFCDNDQISELSYWIENYNLGENATVWVKVPSIPSNDNRTFYMYYGNPNANPESDESKVFDFIDNFDNATKFSTVEYPYGDPNVAIPDNSNFVKFGNTGNEEYIELGSYDEGELRKDLNLPFSSYEIVVQWRTDYDPFWYDSADYTNYDDEYGASTITPKRLIVINENKIYEKDNRLLSYSETTEVSYTGAIDNFYLSVGSSGSYIPYYTYYDLALIRKFTDPDPVVSVGEEEPNNAPSAPNLLEPANNEYENDSTPLFTWENSIDPEGDSIRYTLQIDNEASFSAPLYYENIGIIENQHELPTENALHNGVYYWRVGAEDMVNLDNWAESFTLTIDTVAPQAPSPQEPLDGTLTNDNMPTLVWTAITTENSWPVTYELQVDNDPDFSSPEIDQSGLVDNTYTSVTELVDGNYFWRVSAVDGAGNVGEWSVVFGFLIDTIPPGAPVLVLPENGVNINDGTPNLDWNTVPENSLPVTYYVAVSDNSDFPYENVNSGWTINDGWEVSPTLPEGVWYWRVMAKDNVGNTGAWSENRLFRIDTTAPIAPVLVWPENEKNLDDNTPNLNWNAVIENSMPVTYDIQVDNDNAFDSPLIWENDIREDNYQVQDAMAEGTWYWRVRANDNASNIGPWSENKWFRVDVTPPAAPTLFSPANGLQTNENTPTFGWASVFDVSAPVTYEIWIDNDSTFTSREAENSGQIDSSYVPAALADEHYNWKVRACDNAGNYSEWSIVWTFLIDTVAPGTALKLAPANGTKTNDNTPTFSWYVATDDSSGIRCYEIWVDNDLDFKSPECLENTADNLTTSCTPTALADENYQWLVRAWDWAGNVGYFETAWTILIDTTPPSAPTLVWPLDGENINDNTPNLDWTIVPENSLPVLYRCHVSDNSAFPYDNYDSGWTSSDNFKIMSELKEGIWYWCVQAMDNAGNTGNNSSSRSFRVDVTSPNKPTLVSPEDNTTKNTPSITFAWTRPEPNVIYQVQIDNEKSFASPYVHENSFITDNSYLYTFARVGTYYWRVRAEDNAGNWSNWSDNFKLTIKVAVMPKTLHNPIYIENNDSFNINNGVVAGAGTEDDPYIIENWAIVSSTTDGISVKNTTAYFTIRNCLIENGGKHYFGIWLEDVVNGRVKNCVSENSIYGIYLEVSPENNIITNNTCSNNYHGIYLSFSSKNVVTNNACSNNVWYGIALYPYTSNNIVDNNTCSNNLYGIYIDYYSDNNTLDNNTCSNNFRGIYIESSSGIEMQNDILLNNQYNFGVTGTIVSHFVHDIDPSNLVNGKSIRYLVDNKDEVIAPPLNVGYLALVNCDNIHVENLAFRNNEQGILLVSTDNSWVENCILENNFFGAYLYSSSNNFIYHNNFSGNENQAHDDGSNHWDNDYPSGGNYWSDYTGVDNYKGENQNIPDPDGIGDTTYVLPDDNNQDRYPLMNPWPYSRVVVNVLISPTYESGSLGGTLSYTVTVTNMGNIIDDYDLTVTDKVTPSWNPSLDNVRFDNVPPGGIRTTTLRVTIPENATPNTEDNVTIATTSQENVEVSESDSCIAHVIAWTGTATFNLENLYKVNLYNDNLWLYDGSKLVVKFYDYSSAFENEVVIESNITPPQSFVENENVPHPTQGSLPVRTAVKKAELDLTTDDTSNIISTIASFTVHQSDLRSRYIAILRVWSGSPGQQSAFRAEIIDILRQWSNAPI
jgi:parallel beta-helix repeat protein